MLNKLILLMFLGLTTWTLAQDSTLNYHTTDVNTILGQVAGKIPYSDTTTSIAKQWELDGKLDDADTASFRTFSNSRYAYKNFMDASDGDPDSAIYVDATGRVGIGLTSPQSNLHIKSPTGNVFPFQITSSDNQYLLTLEQSATGGAGRFDVYDANNVNKITFNGGSNSFINTGNFGIGNITPNNKLNVDGAFNFATDTSTAAQPDIYDLVISGLASYTTIVAGTQVSWIAATANTGACNILINALAQKDLFKKHDQELISGDIEVGQIVVAIFDGTQWQMISQLGQ